MTFDRRMRDELQRAAAEIEPDVERQLGAVEARASRRGGIGGAVVLLAAAILIAAVHPSVPDPPSTEPGVEP